MFIILGARRSGTHMLASLLDSHPDLRCFDEILLPCNTNLALGWKDIAALKDHEGCIATYRRFLKAPTATKELIAKNKVVHIMRRNLENHAESIEKMAHEDLRHTIEWRKSEIQNLRRRVFNDRKFSEIFEIYYEDICQDKNISEYKNSLLLKFLGVKNMKLTTKFTKGKDPRE